MEKEFEAIIIGGSYAGLSAAMSLGRSLRRVLIIDGGKPCNRFTPHSHNFITEDGEKPATIAKKAKKNVLKYGTVKFLEDVAIDGKKTENGFLISTQNNGEFMTQKLVFATGIKDVFPQINGFAECWGNTVIHCPYCHGYEFRGQKTGILADGPKAFHLASLVKNLTQNVAVLTNGKATFDAEQIEKLKKHGIKIIETGVAEIEHKNGQIKNVIFADGSREHFGALYAGIPFVQHSEIPVSLGCEMTEHGYLKIDGFQKTNIAGVFACGDNSTMMRAVAAAVYAGNLAGAMVNMELTHDQF